MAEYNPNFKQLIYERKGDKGEVLWLSFNNPEMMNSLTETAQLELVEALESVMNDNSVRVVVLTGTGEKSFCSGGDIGLLNKMTHLDGYDFLNQRGNHVQRMLTKMDKPVIAAVNGYCFGGGMELALCCDIIYASENASFGLTEINIGILPGWGGTIRLPRTISINRAKEMIFTGERIKADEAFRLGLVNKVLPADELIPSVEKLVNTIISKPPLAVRAAKTIINDSLTCGSWEAAQSIERGLVMWLIDSEDFKEGTSSFIEKRKPDFKGK